MYTPHAGGTPASVVVVLVIVVNVIPNCVDSGDGGFGSGTRMLRSVTVYAATTCVAAESSGHGSVHGSTMWAPHPVDAE